MPDTVAVRVPQLNVNDERVRIVSWLIACGGRVERGQPLVTVETGKSTAEIEAPEGGFVQYTHAPDDEVAVGDVLCTISAVVAPPSGSPRTPSEAPPLADAGGPHAEPAWGGNGAAQPKAPRPAFPSPEVTNSERPAASAAPAPATGAEFEAPTAPRFSARARVLLAAHDVDPPDFPGSGLVREGDVLRYFSESKGRPPAAPTPPPPGRSAPTRPGEPAETVPVRREPLSRQKLTEVQVLAASCSCVLASSVTVTCPTTGFRRAAARDDSLRGNATALIVFEVARLLRRYPVFNGYYGEQQACYYDRVNIGFAVDAGRGLKVLVVHDADVKTAGAIADEMHERIAQYLEDRLPLTALSGGTFTISDLSGEGVTTFAPLINQNQSAILGVGAERLLPHSEGGEFNLILTFDHRLSEGRTAAQFLNALRERLAAHEAALGPLLGPAQTARGVGQDTLSCGRCMRTANELRQLDGCLVRSAVPGEYLCNLCLAGL